MQSGSPTRNEYPEIIEAYWLDALCKKYRSRDIASCSKRLSPIAGKLSDLFTSERKSGFESYSNSEELLLAYGLYIYPQTWSRMSFLARELRRRFPDLPATKHNELRILDLGSGSGAAAFSLLHSLSFDQKNIPATRLTLVDQSKSALRVATDLHKKATPELWSASKIQTQAAQLEDFLNKVQPASFDIVLCSFALGETLYESNETSRDQFIKKLLSLLAPDALLILLEPALKETATRLMQIRDTVTQST
ncbi:MAG: methyltransferase domain-containing protein, partial [Chthoniobacterales bacterium]